MFGIGEQLQEHHSGKESHLYVEKLIRSAKELWIVSPYLDVYYANFLRDNARGKRIRILSSSPDLAAEKILFQNTHPLVFSVIVIIIALIVYSQYSLGGLSIITLGAAFFIVIASGVLLLRRSYDIKMRRPKDFVHMKLYITDKYAIQGSANLTYNGLHSNVEHVQIIRDEKIVEELRKDFLNLWNQS